MPVTTFPNAVGTITEVGGADFESGDTEVVDMGAPPPADLRGTGAFSIGFWIKRESTGLQYPACRYVTGGKGWYCHFETDGTFQILPYDSAGNRWWTKTTMTFNVAEWYHVIWSVQPDATTPVVKCFVNGVEVTTVARDQTGLIDVRYDAASHFGIGAVFSASWTGHFDGIIHSFRYYDTAITDEAEARTEMLDARSSHANLVEEWPLEEDFAATVNSPTNDGTETSGTIPFVAGFPFGQGNTAIDLDGASDYITFGDITELDGLVAPTFEGWVKAASNGTHWIFGKYNSQANQSSFYIQLIAGSSYPKLGCVFIDGGSIADRIGWSTSVDAVPLDGAFHHWALVVDLSAETAQFYVDGVAKTTVKDADFGTPPTAIADCSATLDIGSVQGTSSRAYSPSGAGFGSVAVWDSAKWTSGFTPSTEYYNGDETGLIFYAPLWEGQGSTVYDIVGMLPGTCSSFVESWWVAGPDLSLAGTTAPTVLSANVNVDGDVLTIVMSETVTGTPSGFSITVDAGASSISGGLITGDTITYDIDTPVANGEVVLLSYTGADIENGSAVPLAAFSDMAVTNNVPAGPASKAYFFQHFVLSRR